MKMRELKVDLGERSYPIFIGSSLIEQLPTFFAQYGIHMRSPLMVITDEKVAPLYLEQVERALAGAGYRVAKAVVEAGEKSKSLEVLEQLVEIALTHGLDRQSTIIALGGGVVGDLAGFAAATYMRGIRFVQVPTTILAHDSSVGGKVAVNHRLAKNIIGAFHQPVMVVYDTDTLQTLPMREVRAGLAEVIKHGLIRDRDFVEWCEEHADRLLHLDREALEYALYRGCAIKAEIVSQDERESGLRAILNLGHTIGHALEAVAAYEELLHGEAISIGMVGAARVAKRLGYGEHIEETTVRILQKFGLPTHIPAHMDPDQIMKTMSHDKKFKEGKRVFIVPTDIGNATIHHDLSAELLKEIVESLMRED